MPSKDCQHSITIPIENKVISNSECNLKVIVMSTHHSLLETFEDITFSRSKLNLCPLFVLKSIVSFEN